MTEARSIIMNFQTPPGLEDIQILAETILDTLPNELDKFCDATEIIVEDFPSTEIETELELDDAFDLLALYRAHAEKIPGVEAKSAQQDPVLMLFRRPILDSWCETEEDLGALLRHVVIFEIAHSNGFTEAEAEAMALAAAHNYIA